MTVFCKFYCSVCLLALYFYYFEHAREEGRGYFYDNKINIL